MEENAGNTGKTTIGICHPAQQHITRSYSSKQDFFAWCPYCILRVETATKQLVEQQSIELIDSTKRRRLRWCNKLSSSIAYRYVSHENYAGTRHPPRRQTNANYEMVLVLLPKQMGPFFNFMMRRHFPKRG